MLCELESCLVEKVFGHVEKSIDYKPYPAVRYLDADPAKTVKAQKICQWSAHMVRYMLARYQMFITTAPLAQYRGLLQPVNLFCSLIIIARLSEDARDAFSQSFFCLISGTWFWLASKDFLIGHLTILEEWDSKSLQRCKRWEFLAAGKKITVVKFWWDQAALLECLNWQACRNRMKITDLFDRVEETVGKTYVIAEIGINHEGSVDDVRKWSVRVPQLAPMQ